MKEAVLAPGTRVRLLLMYGPQSVPVGTLGTVTASIDKGSSVLIGMRWDNGSRLGLAVPPDQYELLDD